VPMHRDASTTPTTSRSLYASHPCYCTVFCGVRCCVSDGVHRNGTPVGFASGGSSGRARRVLGGGHCLVGSLGSHGAVSVCFSVAFSCARFAVAGEPLTAAGLLAPRSRVFFRVPRSRVAL
jgi:hypothetical protein